MTKRDKREQRIRQNVKQGHFDDLDAMLRDYDFDGDATTHHVVYHHPRYSDRDHQCPETAWRGDCGESDLCAGRDQGP